LAKIFITLTDMQKGEGKAQACENACSLLANGTHGMPRAPAKITRNANISGEHTKAFQALEGGRPQLERYRYHTLV
jgi:hypothetical protein